MTISAGIEPHCAAETLPSELLINILKQLPAPDLKSARSVCKRWASISNLPLFHQSCVLRVTPKNCADILAAQQQASAALRGRIQNLCLELPLANTADVQLLLIKQGSHVRSLRLKGVLHNLPPQTLDLLEELRISCTNESELNLRDMPCLRTLTLEVPAPLRISLLQQLTHSNVEQRLQQLQLEFSANEQELLLQTLQTHANSLQQLELSYFCAPPLHLLPWRHLAQQLSHLQRLQLTGNFKNRLLADILERLPAETQLRELDLAGNLEVDDATLTCVLHRWPHTLEQLNLMFCRRISDAGIAKLAALRHSLRVLNLSHCGGEHLTVRGLLEGIAVARNVQLRSLHLNNWRHLNEDGLCLLAQRLPNLLELNVGGCSNAVTDRALTAIFRFQCQLQSLDLDHCHQISDRGLLGLCAGDDGNAYPIHRLRQLNTLNLRACRRLSNQMLQRALHCDQLRSLQLDYCPKLTSLGIEALVMQCRNIETLSLSSCRLLDDEAVWLLVTKLKRLRNLNLNNCALLTPRAVDCVIEYGVTLVELSIEGNALLEAAAVQERLLKLKPHLVQVSN